VEIMWRITAQTCHFFDIDSNGISKFDDHTKPEKKWDWNWDWKWDGKKMMSWYRLENMWYEMWYVTVQHANRICKEQKPICLAWLRVCRQYVLFVCSWRSLFTSSLQLCIYNWSTCEDSVNLCHLQEGTDR